MAHYVDGFVIPLPKKNLGDYRRGAQKAARYGETMARWNSASARGRSEHQNGKAVSARIKTKPGETVLFSYIVFKSRAHRDRVNAKVMRDPRLAKLMKSPMPFDVKRMLYGGFKTIVEA